MNKCLFLGRLGRDPEVRYSTGENATAIARFSLAVDRKFKRSGDEQTADFINCLAFGKQAEFCEKYLKQGTKIVITSHVQCGSYTNKDGAKVYTTDFVIDEVEFAESKSHEGGNNGNKNSRPEPSSAMGDGFMNIPSGIDEELPFN
jgi:single-strand DNA-binding protein